VICSTRFSFRSSVCSCDYADIDECAVNNGGCATKSVCTNSAGSFTCSCPPGYTGNGRTCTRESCSLEIFGNRNVDSFILA